MKILVIADEESKILYDYYQPGMLDDIDLILSCGDLHASYLSFLVTMSHAPVLFVNGNHDHYREDETGGCICIDDDIYVFRGVRILDRKSTRMNSCHDQISYAVTTLNKLTITLYCTPTL